MNILIAPDSFKDSLTARQVALAIKKGMKKVLTGVTFQTAPMADGGEGTVEAVIDATSGTKIELKVMDPLMREVPSFYGITGDGSTAVIEMAAASGIELLDPSERNPWLTSTFGTGQLIADALDKGCRNILLGIGGSATNDCGAGMAEALGVRFSCTDGASCRPGGGALGDVASIHLEKLHPAVEGTRIRVACDVSNPLTGPEGASFIYGPQKGADTEMVKMLDANLKHFAELIKLQLGMEVSNVAGAGAAGGMGAGVMAFLNGSLTGGFELVAETLNLEEKIRKADLVITGEGKMDGQTLFGKTPYGVAQLARKHHKKVIGVAGTLEEDAEILYDHGFSVLMPILEKPVNLEYALLHAERLLEHTGERIARWLKLTL